MLSANCRIDYRLSGRSGTKVERRKWIRVWREGGGLPSIVLIRVSRRFVSIDDRVCVFFELRKYRATNKRDRVGHIWRDGDRSII